ncbi:Animal heme peroxidase homologue [Chondrus crispus]|uniref:Animal heme peroxidase homologue n=1 Tax=Chondrus crispus TaxID=2769 RepID=R7Q9P4_CHOCR|nr:Animal heme peroxidase homologue [Chondrus crispus]CDF34200.1 Animal heme peroxidase homologue [Chondrus crispus]|eukprot:XP_005714019.1 Animal heme peroxidase homologue [Chondrus crispus]
MARAAKYLILSFTLFLSALAHHPQLDATDGLETTRQVNRDAPSGAPSFDTVCNPNFRSFDGTCTNPQHRLLGSKGRAHASLEDAASSVVPTGADRPSARFVSNALCRQSMDAYNKRGVNELAVFFGQFIDHTIVSTPSGGDAFPIAVPNDDPIFANVTGKLKFTRSARSGVEVRGQRTGAERPTNALPAALDLSTVYGDSKVRADALRSFRDGKLKNSSGNLLPLNDRGLSNSPNNSPGFFVAGETRVNEHPMLTCLHTLFMREHNSICDELAQAYPDYNDEQLYQTARKINGAQFAKIVFEEFYPAMTGRALPAYRGFRPDVDVSILDVFSTAAFRVGHTMVGNVVRRVGRDGVSKSALRMSETFFRGADALADGIDDFLRAAAGTAAQEVDLLVHDSVRDFLFTGVAEESGVDLIALNIQRGRDHAIPGYARVRELVGLGTVRGFADMPAATAVRAALMGVYGKVESVDAWVGMVAESKEGGMGETMGKVWEMQFERLRDGDAFYWRGDEGLMAMRGKVGRVTELFEGGGGMAAVLRRNSEVRPRPGRVFFVE